MLARLKHATTVPLWTAELLTGAKSFEGNGVIGSQWLNQRGLHVGRVRLAHRLAEARRVRLAAAVRPEDRMAFDRDGYVVRRDFLPTATFDALLAELRGYPAKLRERFEGDSILRKTTVTPDVLRALPALASLLATPDWDALIRYVGGRDAAPVVHLQSILQHAQTGPRDPQTYPHADTFHPTVKAWFYLTDVAEDAGPLTYVPGSHRLTPSRLAWEQRMSLRARQAEDEDTRQGSFRIEAADLGELGLPMPRPLAVPANTLIVADTFGFHARGRSLRPSLRVEVWAFGRRNPFLPWTRLDPLVSAVGLPRVADWRLRTGTLFDPAG
ncbi:phytanoyl-CoA dioxygenase family protein [Rhodopila sp.]|uniref:phytanoyl-CoA dioxygenase family protein n=1 Tax=Rhodopila sp. TaxID=2480087 RepID=UPI003D10B9DA